MKGEHNGEQLFNIYKDILGQNRDLDNILTYQFKLRKH